MIGLGGVRSATGRRRARRAHSSLSAWAAGLPAIAIVLALAGACASASAEPLCTDKWVGPSEGSWRTAADWSAGHAPGSGDVACVGSGVTVQVSEGTNQASVLQDEGSLLVSGGSLEITSALEASSVSTIALSGGSLSVADELDVSGSFASSGSSKPVVNGGGKLLLEAGATGTIGGCSPLVLSGVTLENQGTVTTGASGGSVDGEIRMQNGAQLDNAGTFNEDTYDNGPCWENHAIEKAGGAAPGFTNTGTFNVNDGVGHTAQVQVAFDNQGTVNVQSGTLRLTGGGSDTSGAWVVSSGATLSLTGGSFSSSRDTWSGSGTVNVDGATVTASDLEAGSIALSINNGSLTIAEGSTVSFATLSMGGGELSLPAGAAIPVGTANLSGGSLSVAGELDVSGSFASSGEKPVVSGSGELVVESGATGTVEGCSPLVLSGVRLSNEGTVTTGASGGSVDGEIRMQNGAQIDNSGTFNEDTYDNGPCWENHAIERSGGSASDFTNTGTFNVNDGGGHTGQVQVAFDNQGTVNVQSGTLRLTGGGADSSGAWVVSSGATLSLTGGSFSSSKDTWSGSGTVNVDGATVTASDLEAGSIALSVNSGSLAIAEGSAVSFATLSMGGGELSLPAGAAIPIGTASLSGGSLSVAGELDVSGSFASSGSSKPVVNGGGKLLLEAGATGTIGGCSPLVLSGVTLENQGTVTTGASGGSVDGEIRMQNGAQLDNAGTFNEDTYDNGPCWENHAIEKAGGAAPGFTNTGTFNVNDGVGHTAQVQVAFDNQGTVNVQSGTLRLTGGGSDSSGAWAVSSGATLSLTGGSFSSSKDTWSGSGTVNVDGATVTASDLEAGSIALSVNSGSLAISEGSLLSLTDLTLTGGALEVSGEIDVSGSFASSGEKPVVSGSGELVVEPGATGTVEGCSPLVLSGVRLSNEGTVTTGASGGSVDGEIRMQNGAQIDNSGTFNEDTYDNGPCWENHAIERHGSGLAPEIVNTGAFDVDAGTGHTAEVTVAFDNEGTVDVQGGTLRLDGGGVPERAAYGSWQAEGEGSTVLAGGTFDLAVETDLSSVRIEGAHVDWVTRSLTGSLSGLPPYVAGNVTVAGSGEGDQAGPFASATIEVLSGGSETWETLCGSLSPGLGGEFECLWATAGGSYTDGHYRLRAKLSSGSSPPETLTTPSISTLVDNTAPAGAVTAPPAHGIGGSLTVSGGASDGGSGVDSWQLQIAPEGSSEWTNACAAQASPISEGEYGCAVDTTKYADGPYRLRASVSDRAGNTHLSSSVGLSVENKGVSGTLATVPPFVAKTVEVEGTATTEGAAVESWVVQSAPPGTGSWTDACPTQSAPKSGSTYSCEIDTTTLVDGIYEMHVLVTDVEGDTYTSTPVAVTVDNTAPTGFVAPLPASISGSYAVVGNAEDATAGVASWTLQVTGKGGESWEQACLPQSLPLFGDLYACDLETGGLENGEYELRAVIVDSAENSYTTAPVSVAVDNAAPTATAPPSISGHAIAGSTLEASTGSWSGAAPIGYVYQWRRCNSSGEACTNIVGATSSTYVLGGEDVGATVEIEVTAGNGAGEASASSSPSTVVAANTLGDLSPPRIAGTPQAGDTLAADPGEWSGARPLSIGYQWRRCNSSGEACTNISGATSQRYTLGEADVSHTLRVVVTASNGEGSTSAASAPSPTIKPSAGAGIRYLYDEAGRLELVDDPSQGAAVYGWDEDGNLTSIQRTGKTTLAILAVTPPHAPPGAQVDITGTGFDPEPANDAVSFDGVTASIDTASATDLIVTVPEGASTGAITVTVGEESTESPSEFTPHLAKRLQASATGLRRLSAAPATAPASPVAPAPAAAKRTGGRAPSPWTRLHALAAPRGKTGLSGQALTIGGKPLAHVTLEIEGDRKRASTDRSGRFVLAGVPAGRHVLIIDGTSADGRRRRFGRFSAAVELVKGKTVALGYTIWMTPLDPAGDRTLRSPLQRETILANPHIPGLEVRLPAGTVIHSSSGAVVRHVNLTAVPVDRPPFPLPLFATGVPTYFTVQPGGAYLSKGAQIVYPNWGHLAPGQRVDFWNYDPDEEGWYVYGKGSVTANGQQVVPDPGVRIWELSGAMITTERPAPETGPKSGAEANAGDPVDLATGLFVYQHTDLQLPDSTMPVALTRTYRPGDSNSYSFGVGAQSAFDIHLWSSENYKAAYLILPNGGKVKLVRTSAGTGYLEAEYATTATPGPWEGATMAWNSSASDWILRRRDGMKFIFGELAPLQAIEDRNGNRITLVREGGATGPIVQIRAPHGRWIYLDHDASNRVTQATDSAGQSVRYEYDGSGRLVKVIDPMGRVTRYAYDAEGRMTKVIDARGDALIENAYAPGAGPPRVSAQTIGGQGKYAFSYRVEGEFRPGAETLKHEVRTVKDPDGHEREATFDPSTHLLLSEHVDGMSIGYRHDESGNLLAVSSPLGSVSYTRDALGNATSVTDEPESAAPLTTHLTYSEAFSEPTSVTDPMGRITSYAHDADGNLTAVTDPLGRQTAFGYDGEGERTSIADPEGHATDFTYAHGNQVAVTDPLGHETQVSYDAVGRPVGILDPEGRLTQLAYDQDNEPISATNPAGQTTGYAYDADGNLVSVTDPRGHTQEGAYNALDELSSWTDAIGRTTSYGYDELGDLTSVTDPEKQTTSYTYDALNRLSKVAFGALEGEPPTSTIAYGYDAAGNLASVEDARAGTYTLSHDADHRLTGESGPGGSVGYGYDADGERTAMTIGGEAAAKYTYNEAGQLAGVETPNGNVSLGYDADGRRSQTTLPDGDSESYTYEPDSELAGIDYTTPEGAQIGSLQYGRDALGRVTTISGSLARTNLPEAVSSLSYDDANELTSREGQTLTYDEDGNLTGDGTSAYAYNDRNQLTELTQGLNTWSFAYDPFGRRTTKTKNGAASDYLYDAGNIATETTEGKTDQLLNGLALDERYARTTSAGTSSYLTDELGSTVALADSGGEPTTEYTYDPFGATTSTGTSSTNPYQYTGRENDGTGLQYNRARYYDPTTTRFASQDPLGLAGSGVNLYAYTAGDPLNYTDLTGYSFLEELGEGVTGFGDALSGGITRDIRGELGLGQPDFSSGAYQGGVDGGILAAAIIPGDEEAAVADAVEESTFLNPADFAGKTPVEIDALARDKGLVPAGPDPMNGLGSYNDPVTGEQRILSHPDDPAGGHMHVNAPNGQRLDIGGNRVSQNSPGAHLPIGEP